MADSDGFISRDIYFSGPRSGLSDLSKALGIRNAQMFFEDDAFADQIFPNRKSGMICYRVKGGFAFLVTVFLFETTPEDLHEALLRASQSPITLAVPDEGSDSPLTTIFYRKGNASQGVIVEDENTGEVVIGS
ncbi:hypothetical protein ACMA5I_04340 [Paracoccaceae bacterium GXU_MW_L88]